MRRNKARKSVGILAFIFWPNHLLWHETLNYLNSLKATLINPNIAAVYFGAATLTWLLIFAQTIKADADGDRRNWRNSIAALFRNPSRRQFSASWPPSSYWPLRS